MAVNIKTNVRDWTIDQYIRFTEAQQSGNFVELIKTLSEALVSWDLPGDIHSLEYWRTLKVGDWINIRDEVTQILQDTFNPKK